VKKRTPEEHALYKAMQEGQGSKKYVARCIIGIGTAMLVFVPEDQAEEV
jgi:hypothetical protein